MMTNKVQMIQKQNKRLKKQKYLLDEKIIARFLNFLKRIEINSIISCHTLIYLRMSAWIETTMPLNQWNLSCH